MVEHVAPFKEAIEAIIEAGGESAKLCYQCGTCNTVCPWNLVTNFLPRTMVREAQFGLTEIEEEAIWQCATCGNCVSRCPRGVQLIDLMVSFRKIATEYNILPQTIRVARGSLQGEGNPWGGLRAERGNWAAELSLKTFTEDTEVLFFPCCTQVYDQRTRQIAVATAKILQKADVNFGILGSETVCCGESIRKAGEERLFKHLAKENIKSFIDHDVKKILVSSPHCLETLKNEYPEFRTNFEIVHISQFLMELIANGQLTFSGEYPKKVAYHDPCYLGRHNKIYELPRQILKSIPGLELVEMANSREHSLCCGGGGARIWVETKKEERFADLRLQQAKAAGGTVLASFCPYCMLNFEDSNSNLAEGEQIEIKDVVEIVAAAI